MSYSSFKHQVKAGKTDAGWGHQIHSYVLDGDLDAFIEASLKQGG